jgi:hypothetical protein
VKCEDVISAETRVNIRADRSTDVQRVLFRSDGHHHALIVALQCGYRGGRPDNHIECVVGAFGLPPKATHVGLPPKATHVGLFSAFKFCTRQVRCEDLPSTKGRIFVHDARVSDVLPMRSENSAYHHVLVVAMEL